MAATPTLNQDFIVELVKSFYSSDKMLEICKRELKFQYLQTEAQKKVIKFLFETSDVTNEIPTLGIIAQKFDSDVEVISFLALTKRCVVGSKEHLISSLEDYLKKVQYQLAFTKSVDLFNSGKHQESYNFIAKESAKISEFKLIDAKYTTVFGDYEQRDQARKAATTADRLSEKCIFGIHPLDAVTNGGGNKGTSACVLARSGKGKSTFMRWSALSNARLGARVIHFQAEGSEKECLDLYDAAWTGVTLDNVEIGNIDDKKRSKILKVHRDIMGQGGEIYVYAAESFDSMFLNEAREIMADIEANIGPIDMAIFDYAELFQVAGSFAGDNGERRRREEVCNKITNLGLEFQCFVLTAMQANDIKMTDYNNPDFVLTRHHISEFKGAIRPFSYFITINHTDDEADNNLVRIYCDKFRKYKSGQTFTMYQALEVGRFYDSKRTLEEFYPDYM